MKRWMTAACTLAAAALVVGTAGPASAQYPGGNGAQLYDYGGDNPQWGPTCMHPPAGVQPDYFLDSGGAAFSPDGTKLAAVVSGAWPQAPLTASPGDVGVEVAGLGACQPSHITDADSGTTLSWSPDGKQLAVTQGGDVHVVNAATGAQVRNLTPSTGSTAEKDPTWNPRGGSIAYWGGDGLRVRPATGGSSKLLVKGTTRHPDYSPDGTKIAYLDATDHIAYLTVATGKVVRTPIWAYSFTWSPDGTSFFFGSPDTETCATARPSGLILSRQFTGDVCQALAWQPTR